jgi:hypothetical protein
MAPKPKMTAQERSALMIQRGAALAKKADYTISVEVMKRYPDSCRDVRKLLVDLGYIDRNGEIVDEARRGKSSALPTGGDDAAGPAPPAKGGSVVDPMAPLPTGWTTLADLSSEFLEWILGFMELVSCGRHALKGLLQGNQRKVPKALLQQILIFATDVSMDVSIAQFGALADLKAFMVARNIECGRRARDLQTPLAWEARGVYALTRATDGVVVVTNRFSQESGQLADLCSVTSKEFEKLTILKNYSKVAAYVAIPGRLQTWSCVEIVAAGGAPRALMPAAKALALCDRDAIHGKSGKPSAIGDQTAPVALPGGLADDSRVAASAGEVEEEGEKKGDGEGVEDEPRSEDEEAGVGVDGDDEEEAESPPAKRPRTPAKSSAAAADDEEEADFQPQL